MTKRLLMLAMDQRPWLTQALYGHTDEATVAQRAAICDGKHMILDGLLSELERGGTRLAREDAAILVDEQLGAGVAERARAHGVAVSMPIERGGKDVYETEPADLQAFLRHHEPELTKVLVRYNPEADRDANRMQRSRLTKDSLVARAQGSQFLFELLVPPTEAQLRDVGGDQERYAYELRPALTLAAMRELVADVGVDVWKLEHLASPEHYRAATELAEQHDAGRCILLGANAPADIVESWLRDAAEGGFAGFAVGRSIWWDALRGYLGGGTPKDAAVAAIGERYGRFAQSFLDGCTVGS